MKFLVDAHLPSRLCVVLTQRGHEAIHTRNLPTIESALQNCSLVEFDRAAVTPIV